MKIKDGLITVMIFIYTFLHDEVSDQFPQNYTQLGKSLNLTGRIKYIITILPVMDFSNHHMNILK